MAGPSLFSTRVSRGFEAPQIDARGGIDPGEYTFSIQLHRGSVGMVKDEFTGRFFVLPEPSTLALLAGSLVALVIARRRIV